MTKIRMRWETHWKKCWIRKRRSKPTVSHVDSCLLGQEVCLAERVKFPSLRPPWNGWFPSVNSCDCSREVQPYISMQDKHEGTGAAGYSRVALRTSTLGKGGKITQRRLQGNRCALKDSKQGEKATASAFGKRGRAFNQAGNGTTWGQCYSTLSGPVFLLPLLYLPCGYMENFLLQSCQFASLMSI